MKSKVYWSGIEYIYKRSSPDYEKLNGGFVYVFIKALTFMLMKKKQITKEDIIR